MFVDVVSSYKYALESLEDSNNDADVIENIVAGSLICHFH